jgi:hypothetical protein
VNISQSLIKQFECTNYDPSLRYGQALYDFLLLDKVRSTKGRAWADKLYNASDAEAKQMVAAATDAVH